jgi:hypothetical protein|nr:MAG TPA: hypothetical protein [Caudoviricetes sp.]
MKAYNVDTRKSEEIPDAWAFGGTHILIGMEESVFDYCKELRADYLANHFPDSSAKIQSIKWLDGGRIVIGFGAL